MYDYKGVTVSGNTLVYENKLWVRVFQSIYSTQTTSVNKTYNIITKDSIVRVNSGPNMCIFRDFIESNHDSINDATDNMVTDRLNLMFNFCKSLAIKEKTFSHVSQESFKNISTFADAGENKKLLTILCLMVANLVGVPTADAIK